MILAIFKAEIEVSKACYSSLSSKVYGLGISKFLVRRARFFSVASLQVPPRSDLLWPLCLVPHKNLLDLVCDGLKSLTRDII